MSTSTVGPGVAKSKASVGILETKKDWTATIGTKRAVQHGSTKFKGLESDADGKYLSVATEPTETDDTFENEVISRFHQSYIPIPSTLNIDLILWHTHSIVCAKKVKSWFKSWLFPFTFRAYTLPQTLDCICVSLF